MSPLCHETNHEIEHEMKQTTQDFEPPIIDIMFFCTGMGVLHMPPPNGGQWQTGWYTQTKGWLGLPASRQQDEKYKHAGQHFMHKRGGSHTYGIQNKQSTITYEYKWAQYQFYVFLLYNKDDQKEWYVYIYTDIGLQRTYIML